MIHHSLLYLRHFSEIVKNDMFEPNLFPGCMQPYITQRLRPHHWNHIFCLSPTQSRHEELGWKKNFNAHFPAW